MGISWGGVGWGMNCYDIKVSSLLPCFLPFFCCHSLYTLAFYKVLSGGSEDLGIHGRTEGTS